MNLEALNAEAAKWVGTPFCANSAVLGAGVCCHRLVAEIYAGAGWLPKLDLPGGSPAHAKAHNSSPILDWFRGPGRQWFAEVDRSQSQPGDSAIARFGHAPHHLILLLGPGRAVHVLPSRGVRIMHFSPTATSRITAVFRPRASATP